MLAVSLRRVVNWTSCSRPPFHSGSARTARECRPSHGGPSSRGTGTSMSRSPARARVHRPASPARSRRPEAPGATARIPPSSDRWSHQLLRSRNPGDLPVPTRRRRGPAPEGSRDRIRRHREPRARRSKSWSLPSRLLRRPLPPPDGTAPPAGGVTVRRRNACSKAAIRTRCRGTALPDSELQPTLDTASPSTRATTR